MNETEYIKAINEMLHSIGIKGLKRIYNLVYYLYKNKTG